MSNEQHRRGTGRDVRLGNREAVPSGTAKRRARTSVSFTDIEWAAITIAASLDGMRAGAWIARVAFDEAAHHNSGARLDRDAFAALAAAVQEQRRVLANVGGNLNQLAKATNATGGIDNPEAAARLLGLVRRVVGSTDELLLQIRAKMR
ncbi:plasmid mobilization protein [Saccharothrix xinjiangensis]|uniref:Mobilization protein MobC n=1 Tax=Saccharothrix xinjiangensis TaxID=204798 RepID=A0ABV9Y3Z6_9PSEU